MEHVMLTPTSMLKQQIREEKKKYRKAIEEDRQFAEVKEIMLVVSLLQNELESLSLPEKSGDHPWAESPFPACRYKTETC